MKKKPEPKVIQSKTEQLWLYLLVGIVVVLVGISYLWTKEHKMVVTPTPVPDRVVEEDEEPGVVLRIYLEEEPGTGQARRLRLAMAAEEEAVMLSAFALKLTISAADGKTRLKSVGELIPNQVLLDQKWLFPFAKAETNWEGKMVVKMAGAYVPTEHYLLSNIQELVVIPIEPVPLSLPLSINIDEKETRFRSTDFETILPVKAVD